MPERRTATAPSALEQAIEASVARDAATWFPDVARSPTVRLRRLNRRRRSELLAICLGDTSETPSILAKVRLEHTDHPARDEDRSRRPSLSTGPPLTVPEMSALEYSGLQAIHARFADGDPRFGAVRPLAHLAEQNTILMEYVAADTLRQRLMTDRRAVLRGRTPRPADPDRSWRHAGAWLRAWQEAVPHSGLPARQAHRDDVVEKFHAYGEFLARRLGTSTVADLADRGAELAAGSLPEHLPIATGHGDFAPRNVFTSDEGRVTVFDPLGRWAVPAHEDLSRFLVGIRLLGLQVHSHGTAFDPATLERRETAVIEGYDTTPTTAASALRCYELLILLDKWSALVDAPGRGAAGRLRSASVRLATPYFRDQARRLLELATTG